MSIVVSVTDSRLFVLSQLIGVRRGRGPPARAAAASKLCAVAVGAAAAGDEEGTVEFIVVNEG